MPEVSAWHGITIATYPQSGDPHPAKLRNPAADCPACTGANGAMPCQRWGDDGVRCVGQGNPSPGTLDKPLNRVYVHSTPTTDGSNPEREGCSKRRWGSRASANLVGVLLCHAACRAAPCLPVHAARSSYSIPTMTHQCSGGDVAHVLGLGGNECFRGDAEKPVFLRMWHAGPNS